LIDPSGKLAPIQSWYFPRLEGLGTHPENTGMQTTSFSSVGTDERVDSLLAEIKTLRRQVEKLAEENADLLKKVHALQIVSRPRGPVNGINGDHETKRLPK